MREVIDAHGHFVPRGLNTAIRQDPLLRSAIDIHTVRDREVLAIPGLEQLRSMPQELDSVSTSLAWLEQQGLTKQVVGPWSDLFGYPLPGEEGERWCRLVNDLMWEELRDVPQLIPVGILPMQDPARAVKEIHRLADLGFSGVTTGCEVNGIELADEAFTPVWGALSERQLPLVMHPAYPCHDPRTNDLGLQNTVGRPHDTDIAVARLLFSGQLARHPRAQLFLMHGGGSIPLLWGRLQRNFSITPGLTDPELSRSQLFFDSVVYRPGSLEFLVETMGEDRVLLGSDYPFPIQDPHPIRVVEKSNLSEATRLKILCENAQHLFKLRQ